MIEALALCDNLGESLAAARLQLALDTLRAQPVENRLREEPRPWGSSE